MSLKYPKKSTVLVPKAPELLESALIEEKDKNLHLKGDLNSLKDENKRLKAALLRQDEQKRRDRDLSPSSISRLPDQTEVARLLDAQRSKIEAQQRQIRELTNQSAKLNDSMANPLLAKKLVKKPVKKSAAKAEQENWQPNQEKTENKPNIYQSMSEELQNRIANSAAAAPEVQSQARPAWQELAAESKRGVGYQSQTLNNPSGPGPILTPNEVEELLNVRKELRERNARIALLQSHFDHLAISFRAEKEISKHAMKQIEELKIELKDAQMRERNLSRQIGNLEDNSTQIEHLKTLIDDLQSDKKQLEEKLALLNLDLFQGDSMENLRMKKAGAEFEKQIALLKRENEEKNQKLEEFRRGLSDCLEKLDEKSRSASGLEKEKRLLVEELEDTKKRLKLCSDKLGRIQNELGMEFSELFDAEKGNSMAAMKKKLNDYERKEVDWNKQIAEKLGQLELQIKVNAEMRVEMAQAQKRMQALETENERFRNQLQSAALYGADTESLFSLGSDPEGEMLGPMENYIAVRIVSAELDPNCIIFADLSGPAAAAGPTTFVSIDFYDFETCFSGVFGGWKPQYAFTTQYQVQMDSFLLNFMESDGILVTLYQQISGVQPQRIAQCTIPLANLLSPSASSAGTQKLIAPIRFSGDRVADSLNAEGALAGTITFLVKMKRPLVSRPPSPSALQQSINVTNQSIQLGNPSSSFSQSMASYSNLKTAPIRTPAFPSQPALSAAQLSSDRELELERKKMDEAKRKVAEFQLAQAERLGKEWESRGIEQSQSRGAPTSSLASRVLKDDFTPVNDASTKPSIANSSPASQPAVVADRNQQTLAEAREELRTARQRDAESQREKDRERERELERLMEMSAQSARAAKPAAGGSISTIPMSSAEAAKRESPKNAPSNVASSSALSQRSASAVSTVAPSMSRFSSAPLVHEPEADIEIEEEDIHQSIDSQF